MSVVNVRETVLRTIANLTTIPVSDLADDIALGDFVSEIQIALLAGECSTNLNICQNTKIGELVWQIQSRLGQIPSQCGSWDTGRVLRKGPAPV